MFNVSDRNAGTKILRHATVDEKFDAGNVAAVTMDRRQIHLKSDFVGNRAYLRSI